MTLTALIRLWPLWVALAASLGLNLSKGREEGRLRAVIASHLACSAAVAGADPAASAEACRPAVAARHLTAVRADRCDAALLAADLFAVEAACSTEVKTLLAHRQAETRRADSLMDTLKVERADQAAAIARAETRARTQAERKARADAAIAAAPRDGDLLVFDAGRLRQLRGEDAAASD